MASFFTLISYANCLIASLYRCLMMIQNFLNDLWDEQVDVQRFFGASEWKCCEMQLFLEGYCVEIGLGFNPEAVSFQTTHKMKNEFWKE